jgi:predicted metal-dependent hydrolase
MIKVRRPGFEFTDDIPFWFNPTNRDASFVVNGLSLMAPAFERFFIKAIREAMPRLGSEAAREEARRFCLQEGQHARLHTEHQNLLLRKHPQLEEVRDAINQSYDDLYREEQIEFALSYSTTIELAFKPLARHFVNNRQHFFAGGDPRITAFVLWHFVEEFEHKHAMFDVYQDVVGDYRYRLKVARRTRRHVTGLSLMARKACNACEAPPEDAADLPRVSRVQKVTLAAGLLETMSPWHDPHRGRTPGWILDWFAADEAGKDMTLVTL